MNIRTLAIIILGLVFTSIASGAALRYHYEQVLYNSNYNDVARWGDTYYLPTNDGITVARLTPGGAWDVIRKMSYFPFAGTKVFTHRGYLFAFTNRNILTYDLADPENPVPAGELDIQSNGRPVIEGDILYIRQGKLLNIYSIRYPPQIGFLGQTHFPASSTIFHVSGGICYGLSSMQMLTIYDCRDPGRPELLNWVTPPSGEIWQSDFAVAGQYVYVNAYVHSSNTAKRMLKVLEIQPDWQVRPGQTIEMPDVNNFQTQGKDMIAFDSFGSTMYQLDLTDPARPQIKGVFPFSSPNLSFSLVGKWLPPYIIAFGGIQAEWGAAFDAADPDHIRLLNVFQDSFIPYVSSLYGEGEIIAPSFNVREETRLLTDDSQSGLVEQAVLPKVVGSGIQDGILYGSIYSKTDLAYNFYRFDVTNPAAPVFLSPIAGAQGDHFSLFGRLAVDLHGSHPLAIYDLSGPAPVRRGAWQPPIDLDYFACTGAALDGETLYVTDFVNGIWVLDIHDPDNPQSIGTISYPDFPVDAPTGCLMYANHTLIVNNYRDVLAFDVSRPDQPRFLGDFEHPDNINRQASCLTLTGHYLACGWTQYGLWFYDLDQLSLVQPGDPYREFSTLGIIPTLHACTGACFNGDRVYLSAGINLAKARWWIIAEGDLNEDGMINSVDLELLRRCLSGDSTAQPDMQIADMDGDGAITATDLVLLARMVG